MNIFIKLKSYILPLTVIIIIPAVIITLCKNTLTSSIIILVLGGLIIISGLSLLIYTIKLLENQGEGTLAPWRPTQKLVITGPYQYIRNPMITAVLIVILGEALIFLSSGLLIWAVCFFIGNTIYFVFSEEKGLIKRFRDEYLEYKQHVPMWFPKIKK